MELAGRYFTEGADEVTFLNITGFRDFPLGDLPMLEVGPSLDLLCPPSGHFCQGFPDNSLVDMPDLPFSSHTKVSSIHCKSATVRSGCVPLLLSQLLWCKPVWRCQSFCQILQTAS